MLPEAGESFKMYITHARFAETNHALKKEESVGFLLYFWMKDSLCVLFL